MTADSLLSTTLTQALDLFLTAKQAERVTARTLANYRYFLSRFVAWLAERDITTLGGITAQHPRAYLAELNTKEYTAWTVHDYARPLKTFLRFLHAEGLTAENLAARMVMPRLAKDVLPAFSPDDVSALLAACLNVRDRAALLFLLDTGVRASEFVALNVSDLDTKTGAVVVHLGKGQKTRTVFIGAKALKAVLRYLLSRPWAKPADPLFVSLTRTDGRLTTSGLLLLCRRIGERSGVKECHPHTFRRTFALESLRAGMDLIRLAAIMGHEDLQILQKYLKLVQADLQTAHKEHGAVDHMLQGKKGG